VSDLAGRGQRVAGMFIAMIGSGLVLESGLVGLGWIIATVGLVIFVAGFRRGAPREGPR
jgi:hypothetical protein